MTKPRVVDPPAPAGGLLHLIPLVALAVLVLNDRVLKHAVPGALTGKLSDFAGLAFFPLVLEALVEVALHAAGRNATPNERRLCLCALATGLVFAAIKTVPLAGDAYVLVLGAVQWPFHALLAALSDEATPSLVRVRFVRDPSDLLALPALGLALLAGRQRRRACMRTPLAR